MRAAMPILLLSVACTTERLREEWDAWYDAGSELAVQESVPYTETPYDFTGEVPIAGVPKPDPFETWFAPDDAPAEGCDGWLTDDALPVEITGVVTLHPRHYIKVSGCTPGSDNDVDSDEKYYGSFFLQDASDGFFVLGDTKVAHFGMGDRVTLTVRAVRESFGMTMISAHDVVEIERGPEPMFFERVEGRLIGNDDISRVVRVEGVVAAEMGGFGEVYLCSGDDPDMAIVRLSGDSYPRCFVERTEETPAYKVAIDQELQRRGVDLPVGSRFAVTGPVLYSFNFHQVNVMRVGQLQLLSE